MKIFKKLKYSISNKKIVSLLIIAIMSIAGSTSVAVAAEEPINSQGNIIFSNGTEDPADDVRFCAEDIQYLNRIVKEQISAVTSGKEKVADIIKTKERAETVSSVSSFQELCDSIANIGSSGTATAADVIKGKTVYDGTGYVRGTMQPIGAVNVTLNAGEAYSVPEGYHEKVGKVVAAPISSQTSGTATAAGILANATAWVNGELITGTMKNNGTPNVTLNAGAGYDIATGYFQGGRITARDLASQTPGDAIADNISAGKTAWVNGEMVTGNGKENKDYYEKGKADVYNIKKIILTDDASDWWSPTGSGYEVFSGNSTTYDLGIYDEVYVCVEQITAAKIGEASTDNPTWRDSMGAHYNSLTGQIVVDYGEVLYLGGGNACKMTVLYR